MKDKTRVIRCNIPSCGRVFEGPRVYNHEFCQMYMKLGWRHRGSTQGQVYYCPDHAD